MKQAFAAAFVVTAFFSLAGEVRKVDMKFEAQKVGGGFAVAKIEPAK